MNVKLKTSKKVGIVGLGLIGGSLGLALQQIGFQVYGLTHRRVTATRAKERKLVNVVSTDPKILKSCDIVIIASPLEHILNPDINLINSLPTEAVITDVGSVKEPILKIWEKLHPYFVPSHPMAGNINTGVEAGTKDLFTGKPWVATPNKNTNQNALEVIQNLAMSLGCKWITADANTHDQAVALISHLPVLISAALLKTASTAQDQAILNLSKSLASSGFADTTRVGGGNPELGISMVKHNYSAILESLNSYQESLNQLQELIKSKRWEHIHNELVKTNLSRPKFLNN
tara:strand:- start:855 stop:1721 length:867 start_codon:yes stop_codon:yes gene_type:complete